MSIQPAAHRTFVIEKSLNASPTRTFAAWAKPDIKRRWFAEGEGSTVVAYDADFREGGFERSRFRFKEGQEIENQTFYHQIIENQRIIFSYSMVLAGHAISVSLVTVEFEGSSTVTRLRFTEQAAFIEGADGEARRNEGWQTLLRRLEQDLATKH